MKNLHRILFMVTTCLGPSALLADPPAAAEPGIWVKRHYDLQYMGFTSTYSCDGLADKLKVLVRAAGARGDLKASPGACASGFGSPDKFANASVTFQVLVPASEAKSAEANGAREPGVWQMVEISARKPTELQSGDCELVEQFRDHVLPLLTIRNLDARVTCIPNQQSGSSYSLRFEVFKPATPKQP